ncbi:hypothetical protein J3R83DRAFT_10780 [Lanmaoa asiatica]|nr:hypothetical protein J3R83DRAFT_10780 [Lanmaoa asiatica]
MSDIPPPYTDAQASPPQYTLPETFTIGHRSVGLLVQPQQLKGHLSMLRAFHNLRVIVESDNVPRFPTDVRAMEPERRWGWFVNIAVERFVPDVPYLPNLSLNPSLEVSALVQQSRRVVLRER